MSCWICDSPDVVYVDVLNMGWCQKDFDEIYSAQNEWGRDD